MKQLMIKYKRQIMLLLLSNIFFFAGCKKDWLEVKQNINTVVPSTLADLKAILNNSYLVFSAENRGILDVCADEFFYTDEAFKATSEIARNAYIWNSDVFGGAAYVGEWNKAYEQIFSANAVLEGLERINVNSQNQKEWQNIRGAALFFRARAFFNLVQIFSPVYRSDDEQEKQGIPLRLNTDSAIPSVRSSVSETYKTIIDDLHSAVDLLNENSLVKTLPEKAAAYAFLARCYLTMGLYTDAAQNALYSLELKNTLIDYNTVDNEANYPFERFNEEVLFSSQLSSSYYSHYLGRIDTVLYESFENHDLRKGLFFRNMGDGYFTFRGNYTGDIDAFGGIAVDEVLLIRAEALARLGKTEDALIELNYLLKNRYARNNFTPIQTGSAEEALNFILVERKKELLFRGLRWIDIKRLNESGSQISLTRKLGANIHTLQAGDPKYVLPIPDYVVQINGINQNKR